MKTLLAIVSISIAAALLAEGAEKPSDARLETIPDVGSSSVAIIPFDLEDNLIVLKVQVNGSKPLSFVLDNGAGMCVIDPAVAKSMGLKPDETDQTTGAGAGKFDVSYVHDISFDLPGAKLTAAKVGVIDLSGMKTSLGITIDGLLGYDFFMKYVVEVDYDARALRLFDPETYKYSGTGESIPVTIKKNHMWFKAKLKLAGLDPVEHEYFVDSGSSDSLNDDLVPKATSKKVEVQGGVGLGQPFKITLNRAERFQIGKIVFQNLNSASGGQKIGGELLHRFTVVFDYKRQRMILDPNRYFNEAFVFDTLGAELQLKESGDGLGIVALYTGSAAAEAGLKEGDIITAIDGTSVSTFSLKQVRRMFAQAKSYHLTVKNAEGERRVAVNLRNML